VKTWDVRPAADRARTRTDWLRSAHSFSYGAAYDPANTHFGLLIAHNEDELAAGSGFDQHPHRDLEIVTWLLTGELTHRDSSEEPIARRLRPGMAQRLSAGSGVRHSEWNDAPGATRYVQMWVLPATTAAEPGYQTKDFTAALGTGGLVTIASGRSVDQDAGAIAINQPAAAFHVVRLTAGLDVELPVAPYLHLFVAAGVAHCRAEGDGLDRELSAGDALRVSGGQSVIVGGRQPSEVLVWEMHDELG
jgi:redox-sensitive bicupin YhaK (pirin superfamily)